MALSSQRRSRSPAWLRKPVVAVGLVMLVWAGLGSFDWAMRFHWFQWHRSFRFDPKMRSAGPAPPLLTNSVPARSGGDLTSLIGIPSVAAKYALEREAFTEWTDEYGYRNHPPVRGGAFPVVVVGDSYMNAGGSPTNQFSVRLEQRAGVRCLNMAHPGRGPFFALTGFVAAERFRERPPRVVVWGLIERDLAGEFFAGMLYQMHKLKTVRDEDPGVDQPRSFIWWPALRPEALKAALPNTSILAQFSARAWNRLRHLAFGQLTPSVLPAGEEIAGYPTLLYREAIDAMKWTEETRDVPKIVWATSYFRTHYLQPQGTELVVLLIPDKEQVYREAIPDYLHPPDRPFPPSVLPAIEEGLREEGVRVVNLLPLYRKRAEAGELLYWPDDTHWTPHAIEVAAEAVWNHMEDLVDEP